MIKFFNEIGDYPEVADCLRQTYHDPWLVKNIKRGLGILNWLIRRYRKVVNEYESRYWEMVRNGYVMQLGAGHSDIRFYLPLLKIENHRIRGEFIQRKIFMTQDYFDVGSLQWLKEKGLVKKGMGVLDIGANVGNHTIYFVRECEVDFVYAFEPIDDTYRMLCRNCELNGIENVSLNNVALGRKRSAVQIKNFNEENYGGTSLKYGEGGVTHVLSAG